MIRVYSLIDTESANVVGVYRSQAAALRAVAETALEYGPASDAGTSLAMLRDHPPTRPACVAHGPELVELALERCGQKTSARVLSGHRTTPVPALSPSCVGPKKNSAGRCQ